MKTNINALRLAVIINDLDKIISRFPLSYCLIKGSALSVLAYNNPLLRTSSDVDILISRRDVKLFEELLLACNYTCITASRFDKIMCFSSSHQVPSYFKETNGLRIEIDINFDIFWGEYENKRVDIDNFLSDAIEMDIYSVKVKTLPPLKAMVQLVLHHYKDMNSIFLLATRKSIKYDMFKDVYYLVKNNPEAISLKKLYALSKDYEIIPYVYYILYYTGLLFNDDTLNEYINAFKTSEGIALLDCYGLNDSERREWKCDFATRLESKNLYELIKDDLTDKDKEKIEINKKVFLNSI